MSLRYSESESENDVAHDELLEEIRQLDQPHRSDKKIRTKKSLRPKISEKVELNDLLGSIKSTRNLSDLKKKLLPERSSTKESKQQDGKEKVVESVKVSSQKTKGVLDAPLHRQAKRRIESEIAYKQSKRELSGWNPIVHNYRVAEQICFPLGEDKSVHYATAQEKAKTFEPRTELEKLTAEILGKSKHNIKNNEAYSEAEKELIKSMSLKEAKKKCAELQKMRALMSYKAAKLKQQSKIKSKQYHRIKKRQKRRDLIRDIEALMVRDPEKAKEKLGELEKDRAFERGTLKHRAIKWNKHIKQTKNPELRKLMEDHLRLGRELKSRHGLHEEEDSGLSSQSDAGEDDKSPYAAKPLTLGEIVKLAVEQADRESNALDTGGELVETSKVNPFYQSALQNLRREQRNAMKSAKKRAVAEKDATSRGHEIQQSEPLEIKTMDDGIEPVNSKEQSMDLTVCSAVQPSFLGNSSKRSKMTKESKLISQPSESVEAAKEVRYPNPIFQHFQKPVLNKSAEFKLDEVVLDNILDLGGDGAVEEDFLAEAYENDSVLGDFEEEKQRVEDEEKPEALDLTLHGWGSWTGPGIVDRKKDRFVIKPKQEKRKDAQKPGVIIREKISTAVADLQPRDVPFPFTSVKDFETFIQQPLGTSWNTPSSYAKLIQPRINTKAGRIIKPLDSEEKNRHRVVESDSDSE